MRHKEQGLPEIPLIELGAGGLDGLAALRPERVLAAQATARRRWSSLILGALEPRSRVWLARNRSPYVGEVESIARLPGVRYAHALNLSTEWACTAIAAGPRLHHTIDWPLRGLGALLVVARHESPLGAWLHAAWPGYVGVLSGLAPGRFAAAFNMPPLRRRSGLLPLDWALERRRIGRATSAPPTHLLRRVFEEAPDFASALIMLRDSDLAMPALFTLAGADGRAVVIERLERSARLHEGPTAVTNQWHAASPVETPDWPRGRPRGVDSPGRQRLALALLRQGLPARAAPEDFSWLRPPLLNRLTRLASVMDARSGGFALLGFERAGKSAVPATRLLRLNALPVKDLETIESG